MRSPLSHQGGRTVSSRFQSEPLSGAHSRSHGVESRTPSSLSSLFCPSFPARDGRVGCASAEKPYNPGGNPHSVQHTTAHLLLFLLLLVLLVLGRAIVCSNPASTHPSATSALSVVGVGPAALWTTWYPAYHCHCWMLGSVCASPLLHTSHSLRVSAKG